MINSDELNQILENLPFIIERDNSADYDLSEDVSSIVYYVDIFVTVQQVSAFTALTVRK